MDAGELQHCPAVLQDFDRLLNSVPEAHNLIHLHLKLALEPSVVLLASSTFLCQQLSP